MAVGAHDELRARRHLDRECVARLDTTTVRRAASAEVMPMGARFDKALRAGRR
jgi:hypothetical protein